MVEKVGLGAAVERKRLTSSLIEDVCVCVYSLEYACIFMLAYTEADANEDVCQLYNWADVWAHRGVVIH